MVKSKLIPTSEQNAMAFILKNKFRNNTKAQEICTAIFTGFALGQPVKQSELDVINKFREFCDLLK